MISPLFGREKFILFALPFVAIAFWPLAASHIVPLPKLAGAIVLAVGFLLCSKTPGLSKRWTTGDVLLLCYGAFVGATLFRVGISRIPLVELWGLAARLNGAMLYLVLGIVLWAGRDTAIRNAPWMPIYALIVAGLLTGAYALLQYFGYDIISWNTSGLLSSLGNGDHTSSFFALVTMAGLWTATDKGRPKAWRAAAAISGAMGLTMVCYWAEPEQRSVVQGLLLVALWLVVLVVAEVVRRGHGVATALVLGALVLMMAPLVYVGAPLDRGALDRFYLYEGGIRMWLEHPLIGVGMSRIEDFYNQFRSIEEISAFGLERALDDLHSVPVQIFAMTGLLGGLPYLMFMAIASLFSAKVLLSPKEEPRSVDRILASISLAWMVQSTFSPDTVTISLAGMSAFAVLAGRRLLGEAVVLQPVVLQPVVLQPTSAPLHWWRWASAGVLLLLLGERLYSDFRWVMIDSRMSRSGTTITSQLGRLVANEEDNRDLLVAVKRFHGDASVETRLALHFGRNGYDDEAISLLLDAVASNPNDFQATRVLALHYQSVKAIKEARRYVNRLTQLVPLSPDVWVLRADMALVANDTADARLALDSAMTLGRKVSLTTAGFWVRVRRLRTVRDSLAGLPAP